MNKKTKITIGYTRTASDVKNTVFKSIEKQEELIKNYCKKNNIELSGVLFDPVQSGNNINRPGMKMLFVLAAQKQIDAVICSDADRLSRNTAAFLDIKNLLNNDGVELIFIY